jgi:hypothetical protein
MWEGTYSLRFTIKPWFLFLCGIKNSDRLLTTMRDLTKIGSRRLGAEALLAVNDRHE